MRIGNVSVANFQSFRTLSFDYSDLGLALISGDTGVGKSTLLDAVSWTIFGATSKEFSADDVRAWDASGPTSGEAHVQTKDGPMVVYRARSPGKNDLYWNDGGTTHIRGKDLADTQRLLEARLGVTADLFIIGSYLTQFSKADSFFIAKAKERRETLEQIADQEFAISLGEKTSEARKVAKKDSEALQLTLAKESGKLEAAERTVKTSEIDGVIWATAQANKIIELREKLENFDQAKARTLTAIKTESDEWQAAQACKIAAIQREAAGLDTPVPPSKFVEALADLDKDIASTKTKKCSACGNFDGAGLESLREDRETLRAAHHQNDILADKHTSLKTHLKMIREAFNPHLSGLQQAQSQTNPYGDQLTATRAAINPHLKRHEEAAKALQSLTAAVNGLQGQLQAKNTLVSQLGWLYDKSFELRGLLMARIVSQIEASTNAYLERYFDAALRVKFSLDDSDKLEVEILNQGYVSPFRALSGGERCLLKLCFSLSLMKAAQDKAGVEFGMIMLDEPLNGLDSGLKIKAYALLRQLEQEYGTVLVIEHSQELKAEFSKVFTVSKTSGNSEVYEQ